MKRMVSNPIRIIKNAVGSIGGVWGASWRRWGGLVFKRPGMFGNFLSRGGLELILEPFWGRLGGFLGSFGRVNFETSRDVWKFHFLGRP